MMEKPLNKKRKREKLKKNEMRKMSEEAAVVVRWQ